ncbi:MAG TPA: hypothetical protein VD886_07790 [Herpetosiphonaceae bacterium]|nr:hypothetical protein [Herpetosiphonaceae bacterium]
MSDLDHFPSVERLWQGALLGTIVHAIAMAPDAELSYELSWEGMNYSRQDSQDTRGTVTFGPQGVVGVIRDDGSKRTPWRRRKPVHYGEFLAGIPADLLALAEREALQYVLDEYEGEEGPIITTAFWSQDSALVSADSVADFLKHGGHVLELELLEPAESLPIWEEYYDLDAPSLQLARALHDRRLAAASLPVPISADEWAVIASHGSAGIAETHGLLAAIGFEIPRT